MLPSLIPLDKVQVQTIWSKAAAIAPQCPDRGKIAKCLYTHCRPLYGCFAVFYAHDRKQWIASVPG